MRSYATSAGRLDEARRYLAGGVASSLRASMKPTPLFVASAHGPRLWDVDGNEYVDYLLGYGPLILGHANAGFVERLKGAVERGTTFGLQHDGEAEVARRITEYLPCAEQVALSDSGTAAVMLAVRLARAYTGKQKVVRFAGHYHGWSDSIFTTFPSPDLARGAQAPDTGRVLPGTGGQSDNSLLDVIELPWNDSAALDNVLRAHGHEIAALLSEPVMCNSGCIAPRAGYLERMRELTQAHNVVLIFDEVITGFRLGLGGAQERLGVCPDLTTLGKALANGFALSAVAGKRAIMGLIADGTVNHLGTLNGNPLATEAALATMDQLAGDGGAAYAGLERVAAQLAEGIRALFVQHGVRGVVNQVGPVFHTMFVDSDEVTDFAAFQQRDAALYAKFAALLLDQGVLVRPSGLWYVSTAHGQGEVDATLRAVDGALGALSGAS